MLVLTRKTNQSIMIGDDIEVSVLAVARDKIRLGITAPREVPVFRKEVYLSIKGEEADGEANGKVTAAVGDARPGARGRRSPPPARRVPLASPPHPVHGEAGERRLRAAADRTDRDGDRRHPGHVRDARLADGLAGAPQAALII